MRKTLLVALAFVFVACDEEAKEEPKTEVAAAEQAAEAKESDVDAFKADLATIVAASRTKDVVARRNACLAAVPKLEAAKTAAPEDRKLEALAADLLPLCFEMVETQRLMKKLSEPKPTLHLAGSLASAFSPKDLVRTYKAAKKLAKKRQDPSKKCAEIHVLADHLLAKANKKTQKLIKKSTAFCDGTGQLSAARFHLSEAKKALAADSVNALVESCVHGVRALDAAPAGKLHDKLETAAREQCFEAIAMKQAHASDAT